MTEGGNGVLLHVDYQLWRSDWQAKTTNGFYLYSCDLNDIFKILNHDSQNVEKYNYFQAKRERVAASDDSEGELDVPHKEANSNGQEAPPTNSK